MTEEAKERWAAMSARRRGALIRAVRRGDRVAEEDRPVAVEVARRELERLARNIRPGRVMTWRVLHGVAAALMLLGGAGAIAVSRWRAAVFWVAGAVLLGSSALFAQRRLDRQVARLARALEVNGGAQGDGHGV